MIMKYGSIPPKLLNFFTDSGFTARKQAQILADVEKNGFRNPISVRFTGSYDVVWGKSRAWAAKQLDMLIPAIIFEKEPQSIGEEIEDPRKFFDCRTMYKPHKQLIAPTDKFWR